MEVDEKKIEVEQDEASPSSTISKSAQKKLLKLQRFQANKTIRRQLEKERKKTKKQRNHLNKSYSNEESKSKDSKQIQPFSANLIIDLGFDSLMTEKEIISMTSQLSISYARNRTSLKPFQTIMLCGQGNCVPENILNGTSSKSSTELPLLSTKLGTRMQETLKGHWQRWSRVNLRNEGGLESLYNGSDIITSIEKIVYLTADTDETLEILEEGKTYIIGGLVDRNRYKSICANKARMLGLRTAKLPISTQRLKTSNVLTVNQVVEIMLSWIELKDWEKALDIHLPIRKLKEQSKDVKREKAIIDDDELRNEV